MSNEKGMIIHSIVGLRKKILYKMIQHCSTPYNPLGGDINAKVDLSNYATKIDFKKLQELIRLI